MLKVETRNDRKTVITVSGDDKTLQVELVALISALQWRGKSQSWILENCLKGLAFEEYLNKNGKKMDDFVINH